MSTAQLYPPDFSVRPIKVERLRRLNRRTATMPQGVMPIVRLVFSELARQGLRYQDLEDFSGIKRPTVKQWRAKNRPSLESLEAVLSVLGFAFVPTPCLQTLPSELVGELATFAMRLGTDIPTTWAALIDIGVEQKLLRMSAEEKRAVLAEREARNPRQAANDNVPRRRRKSAA
ncbi:hypothetical protein [Nitrobacter sp. JJSN]|uniref:hypothetical protein n=1 Tax=Nitrobacter sp. JJSN TaxID=3453033 RepID=UPI003F7688E5